MYQVDKGKTNITPDYFLKIYFKFTNLDKVFCICERFLFLQVRMTNIEAEGNA